MEVACCGASGLQICAKDNFDITLRGGEGGIRSCMPTESRLVQDLGFQTGFHAERFSFILLVALVRFSRWLFR